MHMVWHNYGSLQLGNPQEIFFHCFSQRAEPYKNGGIFRIFYNLSEYSFFLFRADRNKIGTIFLVVILFQAVSFSLRQHSHPSIL